MRPYHRRNAVIPFRIRTSKSNLKNALLVLAILSSGCAYAVKPTPYRSVSSLLDAMQKNSRPLTSMKALASVSVRLDGRGAEFPEGIIMSGTAIRLETLNLFYQPVLIIVYNGAVAVLDTGTGACGISSATLLQHYTHIDVSPKIFESLITARLIAKPQKIVSTSRGSMLQGTIDKRSWSSEVDDDLALKATTVGSAHGDGVTCTYREYTMIDGVRLPMRVTCTWGKNRLATHYRQAGINVPVDPSLMDTDNLCGYDNVDN